MTGALNPWPPEHQVGALSTELWELMESKVIFNWVHMWQASCILLGLALFEVIMSSDKGHLLLSTKNHHLYSLITTYDDFDSANPSSMQGCLSHMNSVKMALLSMSSRSSVDRVPTRCSRGHRCDSCRGLRFFFVPCSCHIHCMNSV